MRRIYLDNAATSFPKPPSVTEAMVRFAEDLGASPGRGSYRESLSAAKILTRCRERLTRLFDADDPTGVAFTLNATDALNQAIKGIVRPLLRVGRTVHAVSTDVDHNSILRPLNALRADGLEWTCVPCDPRTGLVDPEDVRRAMRPDTALVALGHASNVTGAVQQLAPIGAACRERDVLFVVDAAQTAGAMPFSMARDHIDCLCIPGHKALLGPLGVGAMILRPRLAPRIEPLREGGTGSRSDDDVQPTDLPDRYESGSHNTIGLAGLEAALAWIDERTVESIQAHEQQLTARMLERLSPVPGLRILAPDAPRVAVLSFVHDDIDAHTLAMLLEQQGVLARAGLHCAPRAHRAFKSTGALRLSAGVFTTMDDVDHACSAVESLTAPCI